MIDLAVMTPTAALPAMPYTPNLRTEYGFVDAFSQKIDWYEASHLPIDQGPIVIMIEKYRTGFLWNLFMNRSDVQRGLALIDSIL
jgi:hypothetical protein